MRIIRIYAENISENPHHPRHPRTIKTYDAGDAFREFSEHVTVMCDWPSTGF